MKARDLTLVNWFLPGPRDNYSRYPAEPRLNIDAASVLWIIRQAWRLRLPYKYRSRDTRWSGGAKIPKAHSYVMFTITGYLTLAPLNSDVTSLCLRFKVLIRAIGESQKMMYVNTTHTFTENYTSYNNITAKYWTKWLIILTVSCEIGLMFIALVPSQ